MMNAKGNLQVLCATSFSYRLGVLGPGVLMQHRHWGIAVEVGDVDGSLPNTAMIVIETIQSPL